MSRSLLIVFMTSLVSWSCARDSQRPPQYPTAQARAYEPQMRELIEHAKEHNAKYPFAAMVVDEHGHELCRGINRSQDSPVLHGEIEAIQRCVDTHTNEKLQWSRYTLLTTAEPCPMCQGAILWAGIKRVVYGTSIEHLTEKGFGQIQLTSREVNRASDFHKTEIIGGVLEKQTDQLFRQQNTK